MSVAVEAVVKQLTDSGIIALGKLENFVPPASVLATILRNTASRRYTVTMRGAKAVRTPAAADRRPGDPSHRVKWLAISAGGLVAHLMLVMIAKNCSGREASEVSSEPPFPVSRGRWGPLAA